ncbi:MAG: GAF domain-containing protein [Armatimonadota bacterium]|nr:GAF domain-containing protein [Armatimonadota bacterium]
MAARQCVLPARTLVGRLTTSSFSRAVVVTRFLKWVCVLAVSWLVTRFWTPSSEWNNVAGITAFSLAFCACAALAAGTYSFAVFALTRTTRDLFASIGFIALAVSSALQVFVDSVQNAAPLDDETLSWGILFAAAAFFLSRSINKSWKPSNGILSRAQLAVATATLTAFPVFQLQHALAILNAQYSTPEKYGIGNLVALAAFGSFAMAALAAQYQRREEANRNYEPLDGLLPGLGVAMLARAVSFERFDVWWWSTCTIWTACWTVFLVETAIRNATAHKLAREYAMESQALHKVSWALVGVTSPMELFNVLASTVREVVGAEIVALYLADEPGEALQTVAIAGPEICLASLGTTYAVRSPDRRPGFHSGHTARAFVTKQVQTADDVFVDVELVPWRMIARDDGRAVSLPIVHNGTALGVLSVYFSDKRDATAQKVRLLETIVAAATVSIETARSSLSRSGESAKTKRAA